MANVKISGIVPFALPVATVINGSEVLPVDQTVGGVVTTRSSLFTRLLASLSVTYPTGLVTAAAGLTVSGGTTTTAALASTTGAFSALLSANLGLTVAVGAFTSRGILDNATANALTLSATGNATIAAPSSGASLIINRTGDGDSIVLQRTGTGQIFIGFGDAFNAGQSEISSSNSAPLGIGTLGAQAINFYTASLSRMTIAGTGAVNINAPTSGAAAALTVVGLAGGFAGYFQSSSTVGSANGLAVQGGSNGSDNAFLVRNTSAVNLFTINGLGNVNIAASTSGSTLTVGTSFGGTVPSLLVKSAAGVNASVGIQQAGQTPWLLYSPASSNDIRLFNGTADLLTVTLNGNVTINAVTTGQALTVKVNGANGQVCNFNTTVARGSGQNNVFFTDPTGLKAQFGYAGADDNFYISNELASQMILRTSGIGRLNIAATGAVSIIGNFGINNVGAPTQITGWGTPTTPTIVANFPGATATLVQCSNAIAKIITDLKAYGFYGA